jgi:phosphoribosylglycinamide formyltransferase 1
MIRLGILASGSGTNLQSILDACGARRIDAQVAVVVSNLPGARALERAVAAGVPAELCPSKGISDRVAYDAQLVERLKHHRVDLVCLAGYMRLVSPTFLEAFGPCPASGGCPRVMNIHPGLLPSFPGLHAQRQCLAYGAQVAGCTVHFVDAGCDTGPIILQAVVPVLEDDTEDSLASRILRQEHRIYPKAIDWFARGRLSLSGRRVLVRGIRPPAASALVHPWDD